VGGGVINANGAEELLALAELLNIPVTMTLMGLGAFPGTHPLSLGMLGMHGSHATNMAVHHCDLLIAVGSRFDDRVTGKISEFVPHAKIIHADIDPASIRKNIHVDIPIVGDSKSVLHDLLEQARALLGGKRREGRMPWLAQIAQWQSERPLTYKADPKVIKPQFVIDMIYRRTRGEAIISSDVGQHQMWTAQFWKSSSIPGRGSTPEGSVRWATGSRRVGRSTRVSRQAGRLHHRRRQLQMNLRSWQPRWPTTCR
jgi:acetolactate synthase-1/2/3 large subunit